MLGVTGYWAATETHAVCASQTLENRGKSPAPRRSQPVGSLLSLLDLTLQPHFCWPFPAAQGTRPSGSAIPRPIYCLWPGMNAAGGGPTATQELESADVPLCPPLPWPCPCPADVRLCGHLRKQKSQRRRFFVLREDPPRLECYESEKKFRSGCSGGARPRRSVSLAGACTISKRADARQRHLIVLYTRDSSLGVAAASEAEQQVWYNAMLEVRAAAAAAAAGEAGTRAVKPRATRRVRAVGLQTWFI